MQSHTSRNGYIYIYIVLVLLLLHLHPQPFLFFRWLSLLILRLMHLSMVIALLALPSISSAARGVGNGLPLLIYCENQTKIFLRYNLSVNQDRPSAHDYSTIFQLKLKAHSLW